jgi:hypothetical protein
MREMDIEEIQGVINDSNEKVIGNYKRKIAPYTVMGIMALLGYFFKDYQIVIVGIVLFAMAWEISDRLFASYERATNRNLILIQLLMRTEVLENNVSEIRHSKLPRIEYGIFGEQKPSIDKINILDTLIDIKAEIKNMNQDIVSLK